MEENRHTEESKAAQNNQTANRPSQLGKCNYSAECSYRRSYTEACKLRRRRSNRSIQHRNCKSSEPSSGRGHSRASKLGFRIEIRCIDSPGMSKHSVMSSCRRSNNREGRLAESNQSENIDCCSCKHSEQRKKIHFDKEANKSPECTASRSSQRRNDKNSVKCRCR